VTLLSSPPQATKFPEGAKAQAITHVVGIVTACSLLVVKASQTIIFPSYKFSDYTFNQTIYSKGQQMYQKCENQLNQNLRGRNNVAFVRRPIGTQDFGLMTFQNTSRF